MSIIHLESLARTESAVLSISIEPYGGSITWKVPGHHAERISINTPTTTEELAQAMLARLAVHRG
jgi:hypothetical protein